MNFDSEVVFGALRNSSTINDLGSFDHGPGHWARVWENGRRLAEKVEGCDLVVIEWFALFHDTMRENEFHDPEHGRRGYELGLKLGIADLINGTRLAKFQFACVHHDAGQTSEDPTIGICWDADRLDLYRVGIQPDKHFMSTLAAKDELDK